MAIRITAGGVIAVAMIAGLCFSQDAPQGRKSDTTQLLAALKSDDPQAQSGAAEQSGSDSAAPQDPKGQAELLDALDLKTREDNEQIREGERRRAEHRNDNSEPVNVDGDAMYMDDLLETIESFVNWHDSRQICLLARAGAGLDSTDARESATRAEVVLPCLQQLSKSDLFMDRLKAARISVALLAAAKSNLDSKAAGAMKQMVMLALHDKNVEVRWEAVDSLERDGGSDMIPALKELAESNAGPNATKDELVLRKNAAKAIASIQQREGQR